MFFLLFRNYLPLEKGVTLYLNKLEFPSARMLVPSLIEISPVGLEKKIFKFRLCMLLFRNYLPLKKGVVRP